MVSGRHSSPGDRIESNKLLTKAQEICSSKIVNKIPLPIEIYFKNNLGSTNQFAGPKEFSNSYLRWGTG